MRDLLLFLLISAISSETFSILQMKEKKKESGTDYHKDNQGKSLHSHEPFIGKANLTCCLACLIMKVS